MITLPSGRKIGQGEKPFIIAEVGSNWTNLEDCLTSISLAKQCGADAVKFQLFDSMSLYGFGKLEEPKELTFKKYKGRSIGAAPVSTRTKNALFNYNAGYLPSEDAEALVVRLLKKSRNMGQKSIDELVEISDQEWAPRPIPGQLPVSWLSLLKERADKVGIEFMCSAFSPELIDAVDPYVNIHKVASAECTHKRMLEKLRAIGKPVILSTGGHGDRDIDASMSILDREKTILLYCVASYPAKEINLGSIHRMAAMFGLPIGYSDHSTDVLVIPRASAQAGACVIEKHVNFVEANSPDSPHSITTAQLIRTVESIRYYGHISWAGTEEKPMVLRHNRRLIATRDIAQGDQLIEGQNFGIYRSLKDDMHAWHPFMIDEVNGKTAQKAIQAGDGIGPGDV